MYFCHSQFILFKMLYKFHFTWPNNSANLPGRIIVCQSKPEDNISHPSIKWSKSANNC